MEATTVRFIGGPLNGDIRAMESLPPVYFTLKAPKSFIAYDVAKESPSLKDYTLFKKISYLKKYDWKGNVVYVEEEFCRQTESDEKDKELVKKQIQHHEASINFHKEELEKLKGQL